jgi:predicted transcriptional regulator
VYPTLSTEEIMVSVKSEVAALLRRLPDDCSVEDIQYHLYVLEKVRHGLEQADAGRTLSQEEAEKRLGSWLTE